MPIENERKYLLSGLNPSIFRNRLVNLSVNYNSVKITQSYIVQDRKRGYVERVRSIEYSDGLIQYILTQKIGFSEDVREIENEIDKSQYDEYMEFFTIGNTIFKTRYNIPMHNRTKWEVDIYTGEHKGTIVAEMELPTPDTKIEFHNVLGKESDIVDITDDVKYKNWYMAGI